MNANASPAGMTVAAPLAPNVEPPDQPLGALRTIITIKNNPIEAMPRGVYDGPYTEQTLLGRKLLWVSEPDLLKQVLLDEVENFPKGFVQLRVLKPITGEGLLTSHGPHWKFQRRAAAPEFTPAKSLGFTPVFVGAAKTALDIFDRAVDAEGDARARVDVADVMTATTFKVIGDALLSGEGGIDIWRFSRALMHYKATIGRATWFDMMGLPAWVPRPAYVKGWWSLRSIRNMAHGLAKRRRARRAEAPAEKPDLLDLLIGARDPETDERLSKRELADNIVTLASAGHETTTLALTWGLYLLALHPEIQERAAAEARAVLGDRDARAEDVAQLKLAKAIIEESMRFYTPTPIFTRTAQAPTNIGGVQIRKGDHVLLALYATHRRPDLWENPDVFDPERFFPERSEGRHRFQFIPFGAGPRVCIGASFAMAEAAVILATVLRDFRFEPDPDEVVKLKHVITLRPANGMPLWVSRRS